LTLATLGITALVLVPRAAIAHFSYREVGLLDLALLTYSVPQRLMASFVTALVPIAAALRHAREDLTVPSWRDATVLAALCGAGDLILWSTHALRAVFGALSLNGYADAEPIFLIVILAAPAEMLFSLNAGLLQATGQSRRLAQAAWVAVVSFGAILYPAAHLGVSYVAGALALSYWMLYATSRRMVFRCGVREAHIATLARFGPSLSSAPGPHRGASW
jgi:O-antigen/teichoic acid export membrane protein